MEPFEIQNQLKENVDYGLVPGEGENWDIRMLSGDFTETVVRFKELRVSEDTDVLNFDYKIVSTPDPDLTEDSLELQQYLADVLGDILENAVKRLESKKDDT